MCPRGFLSSQCKLYAAAWQGRVEDGLLIKYTERSKMICYCSNVKS